MYSPYSSNTQRNKSRLYLVLFLLFLGLIVYWRYNSNGNSKKTTTFETVGENVDSIIDKAKDKVSNAKDKVNDLVDNAKDKAKQAAENVEQGANDIKKKL